MKIVYLNPTGQLGGAEASLLTLMTALSSEYSGFEPHLITTAEGPLTERCKALGISVEVLALPARLEQLGDAQTRRGRFQAFTGCARLVGNGPDLVQYAKRLAEAVRRQRADLIHTNGLKMHLVAAFLGKAGGSEPIPVIGHIHDYVSERPLAGKLLQLSASRFAWFVANSESVARDVRAFLRTDRVSAIYNAVDTDRYSPHGDSIDLDRVCGMPTAEPGTIRIGLAATFARWKGHLTFLRALAKIDSRRPVRGFVIGGPIYRTAGSQFSTAELQAHVAQLGLQGKVGFSGFVEDTSVALRSLDIVVHASTAREPFGLAIVEAMACEKATIVSNAGGAAELFEEGVTGLGHQPGNESDLARRMAELVDDAALRKSLGSRARRSALCRFQKREMAARFWQVYNRAAGKGTCGVVGAGREVTPV